MEKFRISRIGHHLYVDGGLEAIKLYQEALGLELYGKPWLDEQGILIHGELQLDGTHFMSISDIEYQDDVMKKLDYAVVNPRMMFTLYFSSEKDLQRAYQMLAAETSPSTGLRPEDHSVISCDLIDQYGVCWHLCVPKDQSAFFIPLNN